MVFASGPRALGIGIAYAQPRDGKGLAWCLTWRLPGPDGDEKRHRTTATQRDVTLNVTRTVTKNVIHQVSALHKTALRRGPARWHVRWNVSVMLATTVLTLALVPSLYPDRRVVVGFAAVVAVVVGAMAMASPLAVAALIYVVAVAVVIDDGDGVAPEYPMYLQGRYRVRATAAPRKAHTVTFTAPIWDDVAVTVDLSSPWAEADRLLACYSRALSSRHQARAASYWRRYCDLVRADRTA